MKRIASLVVILLLVAGLVSGSAAAYFVGSTQNPNDAFSTAASWTKPTLLNDGFEGDPWDAMWDGNGNTSWNQSSTRDYSGNWSALSEKDAKGSLTTDDIDTSATDRWIRVSFWYYPENLNAGDLMVKRYKPSTFQYLDWYDITSHSSYQPYTWCYFDEYITDSGYFASNFRLRFDSSINTVGQAFYLDDVLITMLTVP